MKRTYLLASIILMAFAAFSFYSFGEESVLPKNKDRVYKNPLDKYWYQGKAELTSFSLDQNRYRDNHPGEIVLIQVTEDFLTDKQVKNDNYKNKNSIPILKTNLLKKFQTGIYDYSIMNSVFTAVDENFGLKTLKTTFSSQDWCGHSFLQVNLEGKKYRFTGFSYFENEGDESFTLEQVILEDEVLNRIRMGPKELPIGEIKMIPSSEYQRFNHKSLNVEPVFASLQAYNGNKFLGDSLSVYELNYGRLNRKISYYFESKAPYRIVGWKEEGMNPFTKKLTTTTAKKKKSILIDYWSKNSLNDRELRKKLDLDM